MIAARPLVLLHGGQHGSWCWERLIAQLREKGESRSIICLDMPGCGRKRGTRIQGGESIDEIAAGLVGELRTAGVQQAILLGHSIAGVLMPRMVAQAQGLFAHLVFLAASAPEQGQSTMQMFGTGVQGAHPDCIGWPLDPNTADLPRLSQAMFGTDLSAQDLGWLLTETAQDCTAQALQIEPVNRDGYPAGADLTYILTLRDPVLPPEWQKKFAARLGCNDIVEIDTGHEPFISHPRMLAEMVHRVIAGRYGN